MTPKKIKNKKQKGDPTSACVIVHVLKWKSDKEGAHCPFDTGPHWMDKSALFTNYNNKNGNQIKSNVICAASPTFKSTTRTDP